jgi:hypothetical protein
MAEAAERAVVAAVVSTARLRADFEEAALAFAEEAFVAAAVAEGFGA